jgi:peptidoglycan/LPS O-acetylase OafA/YrhL
LFGGSPNCSSYKRRLECALVILVLLWSVLIISSGWESYTSPRLWLSSAQNIPFITLASLVFAVVLLLSLNETSLFSKFLRQRVLTHIGRISYGLYLYHVLTFILVDLIIAKLSIGINFPLTTIVIKLTLLYGVAMLSYRYFEMPFLQLKSRFARQRSMPEVPVTTTSPTGARTRNARS